jgi:peptidoglycan/LPS O-acetylase OafA/YrhL
MTKVKQFISYILMLVLALLGCVALAGTSDFTKPEPSTILYGIASMLCFLAVGALGGYWWDK